ncbi:hypothetical protein VKT23_016582 [Stygiomarasmius scandens]|uniref:Cellobiose dehydrogenase cytochrome domain-containing protein n=1 Tax=Marasmiellus scandens TaxID=2682957 RepID=A0ABR1IUU8_9AGAR
MLKFTAIALYGLVLCTLSDAKFVPSLQTVKSEMTNTSVGIAFPMDTSVPFGSDFLANITTHLPYGFTGFTASSISPKMRALAGFGTAVNGVFMPMAYYMEVDSNGSQLQQAAQGSVLTLSNQTWYDDEQELISWLFRCQNCSGAFKANADDDHFSLQIFWSGAEPIYPPGDNINAVLPLVNVVKEDVAFNGTAARTVEYEELLNASGLM